ncbi:hypothetical protein ACFL4L_04155 [bacterium]
MPRGDGTGPSGQGSGTGRGGGKGGGGRGSWDGAGPGGQCICSICSVKVAHQPGVPCSKMPCPNCGQPMRRQ